MNIAIVLAGPCMALRRSGTASLLLLVGTGLCLGVVVNIVSLNRERG